MTDTPCTAILLDLSRVAGYTTRDHPDHLGQLVFVADDGRVIAWDAIDRLDTFAEARARGGRSTSAAKRAASAANGKRPVREGRRPRGRPRKAKREETI